MRFSKLRSLFAVLEVCSVFAAGSLLGFLLAQQFGVALRNPLLALIEQPDLPLVPLAGELAVLLFWQYLGWGLCAGLLWWLRPRRPSSVEVTRWTTWTPKQRLAFVTLITALAAVPMLALTQAQAIWQFGARAPWFDILQQRAWDWQFWIFTAVGSFAVIPVVEELFYRGYVFRRLADAAAPISAAVLSATLFAFSHAQYLQVDAFNIAMLAAVSYLGLLLAAATWYSRSLLPAIMAHAFINLPMQPLMAGTAILAAAFWLIVSWPRWCPFRQFLRAQLATAKPVHIVLVALVGGGFAALFHRYPMPFAYAGLPIWLSFVIYRGWRRLRAGANEAPHSLGAG